MSSGLYAFNNSWERARERLDLLQDELDPITKEYLERFSIAARWSCLEVGAGGGSITEWLCGRVGRFGHVVAMDLDVRHLGHLTNPNLEVRAADVVSADIETDAFDFVFSRLTLLHIPERFAVIEKLVAALRPGGWLLLCEPDHRIVEVDPLSPADLIESFQAAHAGRRVHRSLLRAGASPALGRRYFAHLRDLGLKSVWAEGRVSPIVGGSSTARSWEINQTQVLLAAEPSLDEEIVAQRLAHWRDPRFVAWGALNVFTWGQKTSANVSA